MPTQLVHKSLMMVKLSISELPYEQFDFGTFNITTIFTELKNILQETRQKSKLRLTKTLFSGVILESVTTDLSFKVNVTHRPM